VKRRRDFDADPEAFSEKWEPQQKALRSKIVKAQKLAPAVSLPDDVLMFAAELCMKLGIDGHRGELTLARAASAYAALHNRDTVLREDVKRIAVPSLRHRMRRDPLETMDAGDKIEQLLHDASPQPQVSLNGHAH
jgi:magnesium chelatase subunit I